MNTVGKIVAALTLALSTMGVVPAHAAATDPDVYYVHGLIATTACAGIDTARQAAPLAGVLRGQGYTGRVVGVDYLCGDKGGVDVKPYGTLPKTSYNANAHIADLAYALARYLEAHPGPASCVGHSMGGLICSYAAKVYGAQFTRIVTLSTPFGGLDEGAQYLGVTCGPYTQCREMTPGSAFLAELAARPIPAGTDITTIGGSPRDIMSFASSAATAAQHKVDYYATSPVNYGHGQYTTDTSLALNVPLRIDGVPLGGQPHSLRMVARSLVTA